MKYFKSSAFLLPFIIIVLLWGINLLQYIVDGTLFLEYNNVFAFWYNIIFLRLGQSAIILSPILIVYSGLWEFSQKLKGSNLQNHLLRENYNKFFIKNLLQSYGKACLPFLIISIFLLIVGFCLLPTTINNDVITYSEVKFYMHGLNNPYLCLILNHLLWILFGSVIINIGLIIFYFVKRFSLTMAFSLITSHFINFGVGLTLLSIARLIGSQEFYEYASLYNFFEGFMIQSNYLNAFLHTLPYFVVSLFIVIKLYSKKEKVVMNFD